MAVDEADDTSTATDHAGGVAANPAVLAPPGTTNQSGVTAKVVRP
jgi:hypothetical protein